MVSGAHTQQCNADSIAAAINDYANGMKTSMADKLQPICDELEARAQGYDILGRPIHRPGVPTETDIDALQAESAALQKPIEVELLDIEVPQADGSKAVKRITLATILTAHRTLCTKKGAEIRSLEVKLARIKVDMDSVYAVLEVDEEVDRIGNHFEAEEAKFQLALETARQERDDEIKKLREDDKAASKAIQQKIQEFMKALS
jgi:hypothetical protein